MICIHKWSKWSEPANKIIKEMMFFPLTSSTTTEYYGFQQSKTCEKCGMVKSRDIK